MVNNSPEIQKFLDSAKDDTRKSGEVCDVVSFEEFWSDKYSADDTNYNHRAFLGDIALLLSHNQISYYKELTSYRKGFSGFVLPLKRVIRKLVAFLFLPVVAEQNEVNLSVARLFIHMRGCMNKMQNSRNDLSIKEREMAQQIRDQQNTIELLSEQLRELSKRIELMENGGIEK